MSSPTATCSTSSTERERARMSYDVAIVGAGIAGREPRLFRRAARARAAARGRGQRGLSHNRALGGVLGRELRRAGRAAAHARVKAVLRRTARGFRDAAADPARRAPPRAAGRSERARRLAADFAATAVRFERLDAAALAARYPPLRPAWAQAALFEHDCYDIDVAALHAGFLRGARAAGATVVNGAAVETLARTAAGWTIGTRAGTFQATTVVDAAGAWGDAVAALAGARPLGLQPLRRTMAVIATDPRADAALPVILDAGGSFYFKPDAGRYWVSPHDEIARSWRVMPRPRKSTSPLAVARFEATTTAARPSGSSAAGRACALSRRTGCRSMASIAAVPGFFWCVGPGWLRHPDRARGGPH